MGHEMYIIVLLLFALALAYALMVVKARKSHVTFHEQLVPSTYGIAFPEDMFPPVENEEQYLKEVELGRQLAQQETLIVAGLAYNLDNIEVLEQRLEYLSREWKDVKYYVYGLDSEEMYRQELISWQQRDSRVVLLEPVTQSWKGVNVYTKMARLRNVLITQIPKVDNAFVLMMDYDLGGPISLEGLYHARYLMEYDKRIGAVYANGVCSDSVLNTIPGLHDFFFPGLGWSYYDPLALIIESENETSMYKWWYMSYYKRGSPYMIVNSAFGGAGLIRMEAFKKGSYHSTTQQCEHHSFNHSLRRQGYKIAVDPNFLLLSGAQGQHRTLKRHNH